MEPAAQVGQLVDNRYRIARLIGRGSMADVFEARDEIANRDVALKILRGRIAQDKEAVIRLQREAHLQEMISHRNVAQVYGGGSTELRAPYLVFELLQGVSMRQVVRDHGRVPSFKAASYIWQALQGLSAAHTLNIFHRDIKPANLMLEPSPGPVERVVLIDFGFATLQGSARLTMTGHVVGSLSYLAPERLGTDDPGSAAADIYALGVIFFELLTGQRPFVADSELKLVTMQLEEQAPSLRDVAPDADISPALEQVVLRALAKDPAERPASAAAMAVEIEQAMDGG